MLEINLPEVVAEVTACCEAYERALVANDVAALQDFFWDSPQAIRYGVGEQLYGAGAISAFRSARVINFSAREVVRFELLGLGRDCAVSMLEFTVVVDGRVRRGRQTQVWARIDGAGWRITSAHVSHAASPDDTLDRFAESAAATLGLPLAAGHRPGVIAHLGVTAALAGQLLDFPLPAATEIAPVFTP